MLVLTNHDERERRGGEGNTAKKMTQYCAILHSPISLSATGMDFLKVPSLPPSLSRRIQAESEIVEASVLNDKYNTESVYRRFGHARVKL